jgi:hypothetical protein
MTDLWDDPAVLAEAMRVQGCGCWWTKSVDGIVVEGTAFDGIVNQDECSRCLALLLRWAGRRVIGQWIAREGT